MKEKQYKDSEVTLGNEKWVIKYFPQVLHPKTGAYCKAARVLPKKEIWLSLCDAQNKELPIDEIAITVKKAVLPIVVENTKSKYGEEKTNEALKELGMDI